MSTLKEENSKKLLMQSRTLSVQYPPPPLAVLKSPHVAHSNDVEEHKMAISQVRENLKNDIYVPSNLTDTQIVEFMNCVNFDVSKATAYIKSAYHLKKGMMLVFIQREPFSEDATLFWRVVDMAVFPKLTTDGSRLIYFGLRDPEPSNFQTVANMRMFIMAEEAIVRCGELIASYVMILNGEKMSLGHVPVNKLGFLKQSIIYLQEASLISVKKIHFVNANSIVEKTFSLLRPFLKASVTESLAFYADATSLANSLDPSILPSELGGTLPGSIDYYKEMLRTVVEKCAPYFKAEEQQRMKKAQEVIQYLTGSV